MADEELKELGQSLVSISWPNIRGRSHFETPTVGDPVPPRANLVDLFDQTFLVFVEFERLKEPTEAAMLDGLFNILLALTKLGCRSRLISPASWLLRCSRTVASKTENSTRIARSSCSSSTARASVARSTASTCRNTLSRSTCATHSSPCPQGNRPQYFARWFNRFIPSATARYQFHASSSVTITATPEQPLPDDPRRAAPHHYPPSTSSRTPSAHTTGRRHGTGNRCA